MNDSEVVDLVTEAREFQQRFYPNPGVDYSWVETYAYEQFEFLKKTFDDIDNKASTIINHLTSGAGLFTLGSMAVLFGGKVSPLVVASSLPSMLAAIAAVSYAASVRKPRPIPTTPLPHVMVRMAEEMPRAGDSLPETDRQWGRSYMIPIWEWSSALLREQVAEKSEHLNRATLLMVLAVTLLLVPLIVGLCV